MSAAVPMAAVRAMRPPVTAAIVEISRAASTAAVNSPANRCA
jgi:hypothetical protein